MARERLAQLLERSGLGRVLALAAGRGGTLVLCYHRIGPVTTREGWSGTAEAFEAQLRLIAEHFEVIDLPDVPEAARDRGGRYAAITFDDGRRDAHDVALPVLSALGLPGTFFLPTGFIDRGGLPWWEEIAIRVAGGEPAEVPVGRSLDEVVGIGNGDPSAATHRILATYKSLRADAADEYLELIRTRTNGVNMEGDLCADSWLTWDMARSLREAGMRIGGHTVTHPVLAHAEPSAQRAEITGCRARLETEIGEPMRLFSYPVGSRESFDEVTKGILAESGVELACSLYGGLADVGEWDPLDVPRVSIGASTSEARFRSMSRMPRLFTPS